MEPTEPLSPTEFLPKNTKPLTPEERLAMLYLTNMMMRLDGYAPLTYSPDQPETPVTEK